MTESVPLAPPHEADPFRTTRRSPRVRYRVLPWWGRVMLVWFGARAVTTVFLLFFAQGQQAQAWTAARPDFFTFSNLWDARWYQVIALWGYPTALPRLDDGHVAQNAWAFLPAYPSIVHVFSFVGIPWDVASVGVALLAGLGAALALYRLLIRFIEPDQAMFAVALFAVSPVSPIMQVGYAESLGFLMLALALIFLVDRQYLWLFPVLGLWALTRPGAIAFAMTIGLHWIVRWFTRETDPFPMRERILAAGAAAFAGIMGVIWPVVAWAFTGDTHSYTDTELAWRASYIGYRELVPFTAWFQGADWWARFLGVPSWVFMAVVVVLAIGFAIVLFLPWVRRLGPDIRLWLASYAVYLLAVFFPQSSTFRILAPMFPLLGALAVPRSKTYRWAMVAASLLLQIGWIWICWYIMPGDWSPP